MATATRKPKPAERPVAILIPTPKRNGRRADLDTLERTSFELGQDLRVKRPVPIVEGTGVAVEVPIRKRLADIVGTTIEIPGKRTVVSLKTAIRDASEALIEAVRKAEESSQQESKRNGGNYIWVVVDQDREYGGEAGTEIVDMFATLEDANICVRNRCLEVAERDNPEADFEEGYREDGSI